MEVISDSIVAKVHFKTLFLLPDKILTLSVLSSIRPGGPAHLTSSLTLLSNHDCWIGSKTGTFWIISIPLYKSIPHDIEEQLSEKNCHDSSAQFSVLFDAWASAPSTDL